MPEAIPDEVFEEFFESNRQVMRLLMKEVHDKLNNYSDLAHTSFVILKVLKKEGAKSQHEIAVEMCHTDASVSKLITTLVEKEYVNTRPDPDNRRRVVVEITQQGRKALLKVEKYLLGELRQYFDVATKKQLIDLTSFNKKLQNNIIDKQKETS